MYVAIGAPAAGLVTVLLVDPAGGTCTVRHALLARPEDSSLADRLGAAVGLGPSYIFGGAPGCGRDAVGGRRRGARGARGQRGRSKWGRGGGPKEALRGAGAGDRARLG